MKITPERLTFEFLEELYREYERDPLPNHWIPLEDIWNRVTNRYGKSLSAQLASAAFNQLYAGRLIKQVNNSDGTKQVQISEAGIDAYNAKKSDFKSGKKGQTEFNFKFWGIIVGVLGIIITLAGLILAIIKLAFFGK